VDGVIITVPHKFSAAAYCKSFSEEAAFLGAVNTLRRTPDGAWHGGMFDGTGFVAALVDAGCDLQRKRALLVGAGGAGSAIGHALVQAGVASLDVLDNDTSRTGSLVTRLAALQRGAVNTASKDVVAESFDVVVNASPMGMRADDPLPVDVSRLPASTL